MEDFQIPEDVAALSADDLTASIQAALDEAQPLSQMSEEDITDEQIDRLAALGDFVTSARSEASARETAATARAEKLANARAATAIEDKAGDVSDVDAADGPPADDEEDDEDEEEKRRRRAQESGANKRVSAASRAASKAGKQHKPAVTPRKALIAAGADLSGTTTGTNLDGMSALAAAMVPQMRTLRTASGQGRLNTAQISRPKDALKWQQDGVSDTSLLRQVGNEKALEGGSLVAAGGWGAPSDTIYSLCPFGEVPNLVELPEVGVTHGGMRYTKGLDYATIAESATGFWDQTEAVAEAGSEDKTSIRPETPEFVENRLDAVGVMVEAGLLLRAGWNEVIEQTVQGALMVHQVKVATKVLNEIRTYTGAATALSNGAGNALDIVSYLELLAVGERQKQMLSESATIEVLLPYWVKGAVRADLSNRTGVAAWDITDAQIQAMFGMRNLRVQWLHAMQDLTVTANGIVEVYPDTVEAIMFQAGTYVKGTTDVLRLDTVYDSVNLKKNDFVRLFLEEGVLVANPCHEGIRVTLPLEVSGRSAANDTGQFLQTVA